MKGILKTSRHAGEVIYRRLQLAHLEKDFLHAQGSASCEAMRKALNAIHAFKKQGVEGGGGKLVCLSAEEILKMDCPKRGYFLDPAIPAQGLSMLYAPRGMGKTFACLSIAHAVATGGSVWGFQAPMPRRVLYVDGEMPLAAMKERLAGIMSGAGYNIPPEGSLRFVTPDAQSSPMPNLASEEGQAALDELVEQSDLIILDNLATLARKGRENDAESWLPVQRWILDLRRRGKSVLLVHHAGKGGGQRGTSAKEDILDVVLALRRPMDFDPEQGARFEIHFEKARGECGEAVRPLVTVLRSTDEGALFWETVELKAAEQDKIKAMSESGMSVRDIASELNMSPSTVHRRLKAA
ncbi:MAG: AAA family ATPase [Proteobacteria bacterium]|nr:AAA family ATPase [Pseudomonadota bacterium]